MNGSMYLVDFRDEKELQQWLNVEPYITGGVWKEVDIRRCDVKDPWLCSAERETSFQRRQP